MISKEEILKSLSGVSEFELRVTLKALKRLNPLTKDPEINSLIQIFEEILSSKENSNEP